MNPDKRRREKRNKKIRAVFPAASDALLSLAALIFKLQIRRDERGRRALSQKTLNTIGYTADKITDICNDLEGIVDLLVELRDELEGWLEEEYFTGDAAAIIKKIIEKLPTSDKPDIIY